MSTRQKSKAGVLILTAFLVYFTITVVNQQGMLAKKELQYNKVQQKVAKEEQNKKELLEQKDSLEKDEYIEKIAREKLGMVKKGEKIFIDANK